MEKIRMFLWTIFIAALAILAWWYWLSSWVKLDFSMAEQTSSPPPAPTPPAAPPADLHRVVESFEKIFHSWSASSNLVAICFVVVIIVVIAIFAWMMVTITKILAERPIYSGEPPRRTLELEKPREEHRGSLPAKRD